jgi:hypothetical protein
MNKILKPKSGYKGVYWDVRNNKWRVKLSHKGIVYLDTYAKDEKLAIKARDIAIIKHSLPIKLQLLSPLKKD